MKFDFLPAFKGDCFLIHAGTKKKPVLILVDGGPGGTYEDHLRPRLMELRDQRGHDAATPLVIDLIIVSHVDDDHINGIIELFREIRDAKLAQDPPLFEVRGLWHNSFDEIVGTDEVGVEVAQFGAASLAPLIDDAEDQKQFDAGLILQSIEQGHELRDLANSAELNIPINGGFNGLIKTTAGKLTKRKIGGITFMVVGPRTAELAALQKKHDKWLQERKKKRKPITPGSLLQALGADESVANLSSIVLLAERGTRKVLLTGDARNDFILKGLEEIGLVAPGGDLEIDLLKLPHHGSDRNVDEEFLKRVTASQYLFTGNGEHGNPERKTFEILQRARPGAEMDLYLTYAVEEIDRERELDHEKEWRKEVAKKTAGKLKGKEPRVPWSRANHSLAAFFAGLPQTMRVIEPAGSFVEL